MKYRWMPAPPQPLMAGQLASRLRISPLLAQCLLNRNLSEPEMVAQYLQPRLKGLADPFLLPNMSAAVDRLLVARERGEPLVIFGDYDVDGVTSTAILLEVLRTLGWTVHGYLPHRMEEGYGLSRDGVENCLAKHPVKLLLAVDCGSTTVDTVGWLRERGVDVIVLDHHQVSNPAPAATALVNPQVSAGAGEGHAAPFSELCSAGLAFKLAHALVKRGRETGLPGAADYDIRPLLDLVALGTIADIVPLTGENRILVSAGLERLNATRQPGLLALKEVARIEGSMGTYEVGFQLAPRLNAAGRLETATDSLRLLMARDLAEAMPLARNLDGHNRERQQIERGISDQALHRVRTRFNPDTDYVVVEGDESWHIGVVGIVASRVVQQVYRPTIIIGGDGAQWRGSGRSIAGFDMAAALRECSDLLIRHGGHAMAAGVSLAPENLEAFRARLNQVAMRQLQPDQLQAPLRLDGEVGLEEMSLDCQVHLGQLKPTGQGNPSVQFYSCGLTHGRPLQRMGAEKQHVKMWVTDGAVTHEAVWWGAGAESLPVGRFDLAFAPQINEYNGRKTVQLKVLDWRPAAKSG
jgi:single-stranded-DNA-specific exonuclease